MFNEDNKNSKTAEFEFLTIRDLREMLGYSSLNGVRALIKRCNDFPKPNAVILMSRKRVVFDKESVSQWLKAKGVKTPEEIKLSSSDVMQLIGYKSHAGFRSFLKRTPSFPRPLPISRNNKRFFSQQDVYTWLKDYRALQIQFIEPAKATA